MSTKATMPRTRYATFTCTLLQPRRDAGVAEREREERDDDQEIHEITHACDSPRLLSASGLPACAAGSLPRNSYLLNL